MINEMWRAIATEKGYLPQLEIADQRGDYSDLESYIETAWLADEYRDLTANPKVNKYYTAFIHTLRPKIMPAFRDALS